MILPILDQVGMVLNCEFENLEALTCTKKMDKLEALILLKEIEKF